MSIHQNKMKIEKKYQVQCIVFDKNKFSNKKKVSLWLKKNNYKCNCILKKPKCYEAKQRDKYRFLQKTLISESPEKSIKIRKGKLK